MRPWETVSSRVVLDGSPWLKVWEERVRLPSGRELSPFYRYEKSDFATIFALDTEGRVPLERRYRHGPRAMTLDLPAGYVERGEEPLATAKRELLEETGYEAAEWHALGSVHTDGNSGGSRCHFFLCTGARRVAAPAEDDTEEAEVLLLPPAELRAALDAGGFATLVATACAARGLLHLAGRAP
ncbi:MAG TPA: NUDIX hydrolase [Candidatus Thermoplasmatota archaeon]|nr:NUDIX hydrolase [Candidatus Thermoplasmatota archaeon]